MLKALLSDVVINNGCSSQVLSGIKVILLFSHELQLKTMSPMDRVPLVFPKLPPLMLYSVPTFILPSSTFSSLSDINKPSKIISVVRSASFIIGYMDVYPIRLFVRCFLVNDNILKTLKMTAAVTAFTDKRCETARA